MSINFTSRTVPGDAQCKDTTGLLFGFVVTPFQELVLSDPPLPAAPCAADVGRCSSCGAYVNPFVKFTCDRQRVPRSWMCYLCSNENKEVPARYADVANGSGGLAELKVGSVAFEKRCRFQT
jgi:hypothetical protein